MRNAVNPAGFESTAPGYSNRSCLAYRSQHSPTYPAASATITNTRVFISYFAMQSERACIMSSHAHGCRRYRMDSQNSNLKAVALVAADLGCLIISAVIAFNALRNWPTRYRLHTLSWSITVYFIV